MQLPSLHDARLVSLLGALMSAAYSLIALVMSATVRPGPEINYDPGAVKRSTLERVMGVFNALTTIFFAYGCVLWCSKSAMRHTRSLPCLLIIYPSARASVRCALPRRPLRDRGLR